MRTLAQGLLGIACCALFLNCSISSLAQNAPAQSSTSSVSGAISQTDDRSSSNDVNALPDSPGVTFASLQEPPTQGQSSVSQTQSAAAPPQSEDAPQSNPGQKTQRPVGTAAAEAPKVSGITAAQPAGVAIAPAKQHRVRTIVIRTGAIIGAGAALGTVIALTAATPSKPPGAH